MLQRNRLRATWAMAAVAVVATAGPAWAFYWRGWPGVGVSTPPSITPPDQGQPGNPPETPPGNPFPPPGGEEQPPPPVGPPPPTPGGEEKPPPPGGPPTPEHVPEPGTALAALAGLGAVAALRRFRRRV